MCDRESRDLLRGFEKRTPKKNKNTRDRNIVSNVGSIQNNENDENESIIAQISSIENHKFAPNHNSNRDKRQLFPNSAEGFNEKDTQMTTNSLKQLLLSKSSAYPKNYTQTHTETLENDNDYNLKESYPTIDDFDKNAKTYQNNGPFSGHPVYRTISLINGSINRMDLSEMKNKCKELQLDCNGKREALKRRLKEHYKTEKLIQAGLLERKSSDERNTDFFVVIDFEATCEEKNPPGYPHEIIEFPAVLVSSKDKFIVDVFHSFVRPTINPTLSEFCHSLTGISQETVDNADTFEIVHQRFLEWISKHQLGTRYTYTMVTDGPFDMGRFLYLQTRHIGMAFPHSYASTWANLRKCFANFYKGDFYGGNSTNNNPSNRLPGLQSMLDMLGLEFEGSPHSGVDDARNIARILVRLLSDRAFVRVNEKIVINNTSKADDDNRSAARLANVIPVVRKEAEKWFRSQKKKIKRQQHDEQDSDGESTPSNTSLT